MNFYDAALRARRNFYPNDERAIGHCDYVSELIVSYLGYGTVVRGYYGKWSHCWVEIEDTLVDATINQFENIDELIAIGPRKSFPNHKICKKLTEENKQRLRRIFPRDETL
jgi:hypothetical protein